MYTSSVQETAGETALQTVQETKAFTFNPSNTPIRVQVINNEPWFVAKDVAKALNISWSGRTLEQIPPEWKGMMKFITPRGEQEMTCITEAGMYKLAFRCQSSEVADKFTNWVAGEVLPSIRKTGSYSVSQHGEYVVIPEHVKKQWLARAEESAYQRFRLEGCKEMVVAIHGVQPVVFEGGLWYNYAEAVRALGGKKADSSKRKRKYPQHFKLIYGRNFITAAFFRLLEEYYRYRQAEINFTAEEGGAR